MAFFNTLACSIIASYFEVLKKNADKFMLGKKREARKSLNKSKYFSIVRCLKKEADEILSNSLDQKEADGIVE